MAKSPTPPGPAPAAPRPAARAAEPLPSQGGSYTVDPDTGALTPGADKGGQE